ncbi:MAG: hypothetical protein METHP_00808 [Methanoregula sp. SKADARSKE-2]|nr:MAG: hypothetical protein METHP_00808 [Methanoregula sp. SKADARSKE-2]
MLGDIIGWIVLAVITLVIIGLIFWYIGTYNRFYRLKNASEATLGQIKVAMKKRLDMIEQLLGAVKSYAKFEQDTLTRVTAMRAAVATAGPGDLNKVEAESRSIFGRLLAVAENDPDLKTNTTVTTLPPLLRDLKIFSRKALPHRDLFRLCNPGDSYKLGLTPLVLTERSKS